MEQNTNTLEQLYIKIRDQNFALRRARDNGVSQGPIVEQTKNILLNNIDPIEEAVKVACDSAGKIALLELELDDAERELDEKDAKIRELTEQIGNSTGKKTTAKKKLSGAASE